MLPPMLVLKAMQYASTLVFSVLLSGALLLSIPSDQAQNQDTVQDVEQTADSENNGDNTVVITTIEEWFDFLDKHRDELKSQWVRQRATYSKSIRLYDDNHQPYYNLIVTDLTNTDCANLIGKDDDGNPTYARVTKFHLPMADSVETDIILMPMEEHADGGSVVMSERDLLTLVYVLSPVETAAVDTNQRMVEMGVWPTVPVKAEN